jgi:hypothetical protein
MYFKHKSSVASIRFFSNKSFIRIYDQEVTAPVFQHNHDTIPQCLPAIALEKRGWPPRKINILVNREAETYDGAFHKREITLG